MESRVSGGESLGYRSTDSSPDSLPLKPHGSSVENPDRVLPVSSDALLWECTEPARSGRGSSELDAKEEPPTVRAVKSGQVTSSCVAREFYVPPGGLPASSGDVDWRTRREVFFLGCSVGQVHSRCECSHLVQTGFCSSHYGAAKAGR